MKNYPALSDSKPPLAIIQIIIKKGSVPVLKFNNTDRCLEIQFIAKKRVKNSFFLHYPDQSITNHSNKRKQEGEWPWTTEAFSPEHRCSPKPYPFNEFIIPRNFPRQTCRWLFPFNYATTLCVNWVVSYIRFRDFQFCQPVKVKVNSLYYLIFWA